MPSWREGSAPPTHPHTHHPLPLHTSTPTFSCAGKEYGQEESRDAYKALMEKGLTFIDTAEVYGFGKSEEFLGEFMRETGTKPLIATK